MRRPRRPIQTAASPSSLQPPQRRALPTPPPSLPAPPPVSNNGTSITADVNTSTPTNLANNSDTTLSERAPQPPPSSSPAPTLSPPNDSTDPKQEEANDASSDKRSPWCMEYEPIPMRAPARPTMRDLTFTYLWGQKVYRPASGPLASLPSLRWLAKNLSPSVLQEGPKCKLVCRLMLRMEHIVAAGHGSWESAFEPHRSNYYEILREKYIVRQVYVAPSNHALLEGMPHGRERIRHDRDGKRAIQLIALDSTTVPADESEEARSTSSNENAVSNAPSISTAGTSKSIPPVPVSNNEPNSTTPMLVDSAAVTQNLLTASPITATLPPPSPSPSSLTVSEFARLMAAVIRNESSRYSVRRREIWDREVTNPFNDETFRPHVAIPELNSIDSASPPSSSWTGIALQREYDTIHAIFLQARAQWYAARSSRDQIAPFMSFVNSVCGTNKTNRKGRMVFVMFAMLRCDKPDEFTDLVRPRVAGGGGEMEPNGAPKKRAWKRRKLPLEAGKVGVGVEVAKITAPVAAAVKDSCDGNGSTCCRTAVEKIASVVAGSAVSAAVTSALSTRSEMDIVQTLETLGKLEAMRFSLAGDKAVPDYMRNYLNKEICALRRKIEDHQSDF